MHVVVLAVVFVATNQAEAGDVRAHLAQPDQDLRSERAIEQLDLTQPRAVVPHVYEHAFHLFEVAEVVQGHARDELEPQADRLHHRDVRGLVLVAEVQPSPEDGVVPQLVPE